MRRTKDGEVLWDHDIRALHPTISFAAHTYGELGWTAYVPPVHVPTLEERQDKRAREVDANRDQRLSEFAHDFGDPHGVLHLQLRDNDDRTNWLTLDGTCTKLIMAGLGDTILPLRTRENVILTLPAATVSGVLSAMAQYGAAVMSASWALKDVIKVSDDPEAIDASVGWPA